MFVWVRTSQDSAWSSWVPMFQSRSRLRREGPDINQGKAEKQNVCFDIVLRCLYENVGESPVELKKKSERTRPLIPEILNFSLFTLVLLGFVPHHNNFLFPFSQHSPSPHTVPTMLVFGGTLQDKQLAMMNSRPLNGESTKKGDPRRKGLHNGSVSGTSTMEMGSIDEEEPPPSPTNYGYADPSATATAKSAEALRRLNQQQARLAKELERTRRRMKEEVSRVRTNTKKLRTVRGHNKELRGGDSDDEEE